MRSADRACASAAFSPQKAYRCQVSSAEPPRLASTQCVSQPEADAAVTWSCWGCRQVSALRSHLKSTGGAAFMVQKDCCLPHGLCMSFRNDPTNCQTGTLKWAIEECVKTQVTAEGLRFKRQLVGATSCKAITVTNQGLIPAAWKLGGTLPASIALSMTEGVLPPGKTAQVVVSLSSKEPELLTCELALEVGCSPSGHCLHACAARPLSCATKVGCWQHTCVVWHAWLLFVGCSRSPCT